MVMPWRENNRLAEWSHRIIVLPEQKQLVEAARTTLGGDDRDLVALRMACAKVCIKSFLRAAKTLTTHQRCAASLLSVYFCGPDAFPEPPNKIGIERVEHSIERAQVKEVNPLIAIVLDLRPNLDLNREEIQTLIEEDRFWDYRRDLIRSIGSALCDSIDTRLTTITYDPLADDEIEDEQKIVVGIRPNLVINHYEDARLTQGYYTTPHRRNTVIESSADSGKICEFLEEFDQQLRGAATTS